jgi:hypothetical protein
MKSKFSERRVRLLELVADCLNHELSEVRLKAYLWATETLSDDELEEACMKGIRTWRFFPKPSEILDEAGPNPTELAEKTWQELIAHVRKHGRSKQPELSLEGKAALRKVGGYQRLCMATDNDVYWMQKAFEEDLIERAGRIRCSTHFKLPPKPTELGANSTQMDSLIDTLSESTKIP